VHKSNVYVCKATTGQRSCGCKTFLNVTRSIGSFSAILELASCLLPVQCNSVAYTTCTQAEVYQYISICSLISQAVWYRCTLFTNGKSWHQTELKYLKPLNCLQQNLAQLITGTFMYDL